MKTISFGAALLFSIFISSFTFAQQSLKKETIKVWGNCGMCKKKIEKAAKSAGASTASWNEETKQLKVAYPANKTSGMKIQEAIAAVGYDTQDVTASDEVYNKLHGCCQYDRKDTADGNTVKKCCGKCTTEKCMAASSEGAAKKCCGKCTSEKCMAATGHHEAKKCCGKCSNEKCKDAAHCKEMACCKDATEECTAACCKN